MRCPTCTRQETILRARLLERLADAPRFVHIRAPAGFGKSTLLDQFEDRLRQMGRHPARINLSQNHESDEAIELLAQVTGIARDCPCPAPSVVPDLAQADTLLIDDADRLAASPELHSLLKTVIGEPGPLTIVLASRGAVDLALARHEASGNLLCIGPHALLFDGEEQAAILRPLERSGLHFPQGEPVLDSLGGWPLGLGLQARVATRQFQPDEFGSGELAGLVVKGTWRLLDNYFEQEVMASLPENIPDLLVRASILETLRIEDCRELFGEDCGDLLHLAYDLGAPLWPVDPEHRCYRILPIFRQFLRARLDEQPATELGGRACALLERRGDYRGASMLALEFGDHSNAARLLERQMRIDFGLGDETRLLALAERIDVEARSEYPRILLAESQYLVFRFEFERARQLLDKARTMVEDMARRQEDEPEDLRSLEMLVLHREMVLALGQHNLTVAQDFGGKLLSGMEDVPPMQRVMLLSMLTHAQQELYIFRGAERYYAEAKKLIPALDSWLWSIPLETFYARHLFQTGRSGAAISLLETTLTRLSDELGPRSRFGAIAAIALAEMKFEVGAVDEADELLNDFGDKIEHFGFLSLIISARITQARVLMARGKFDQGFAVLERPTISTGEMFDKLSRSLTIERTYWQLRLVREDAPRIAGMAAGLSIANPPDPHSSAGTAEEAHATAWIQLARAGRRFEEAIQVAQKWQRYTEGIGATRSNVRWLVVLASLRNLANEPELAMRHLRRAIKLGASGEYRAPFLAEVDVLHEKLAILTDSDLTETERTFVRSIIGMPKAQDSADEATELSVPLGTFSPREMAILQLIAKGQINREIGATLGITEGTVKWYVHKIYDTLGIRRRSQVAMLISQRQMRAHDRRDEPAFSD